MPTYNDLDPIDHTFDVTTVLPVTAAWTQVLRLNVNSNLRACIQALVSAVDIAGLRLSVSAKKGETPVVLAENEDFETMSARLLLTAPSSGIHTTAAAAQFLMDIDTNGIAELLLEAKIVGGVTPGSIRVFGTLV